MSMPATLAKRVRTLSPCKAVSANPGKGGVVLWMSRDQRVQDNWALLHARQLALRHRVGLSVIFCLVPTFSEATIRHYGFMIKGLTEVETELRGLGIPFHCLLGDPVQTLPAFAKDHEACALVSDFSPLRVGGIWKSGIAAALPPEVPFYEVDTHNVVPVWIASDKQEVGARTIRKKITEKLPTWLTDIPKFDALPADAFDAASSGSGGGSSSGGSSSGGTSSGSSALRHSSSSLLAACNPPTDWDAITASLTVDRSVGEIDWCEPGYAAGMRMAHSFLQGRIKLFADQRNDPNVAASSDLSPYFHFGQISPQRVALLVKAQGKSTPNGVASFLEEAIVRRELADNFCFYQPNYDSLDGAAGWARDSLELHASDKREYMYTLEELDQAKSHEDIWNAAQRQMVATGKMHGFMRMYWAKKILEWSPTPAEALRRANYLNDRYSIDGRDPNGYVGCAWSIMGTHDMGWAERAIFGKIRFMNYNGCKRKFDLKAYCATWGSGPITGGASSIKKAGAVGASGSKQASIKASLGKAAAGKAAVGKAAASKVGATPSTAAAVSPAGKARAGKGGAPSASALLAIKATLEKDNAPTAELLAALRECEGMGSCPRELLEETKIGVAVGHMRRHPDEAVSKSAASVVAAWKAALAKSRAAAPEAAPAAKKQKQQ